MLRRFLIPITICVVLAASVVASAEQPSYLELTVLTTNDLHANLVPFDQSPNMVGKIPHVKDIGGAARRATYITRVRAESKCPVLLLDSGDTTFGTNPIAKAFHGAPDVEVLNALGYIAMEPGNHEFQWQSKDTLRNLKASQVPWICANLVDQKTGKLFLTPYIIREYGGVKIAFFGLITSMVNDAPYKAARELGLRQVDGIGAAKKLVPELRKQADIVICLSHLGVNIDEKLAKEVPGIDIILGGHSHTRLPHPRMVQVSPSTATSLGQVPIVQAFCWGSEMGDTRVVFRRDPAAGTYSLMSCKGELISIDSSLPDDPAIAAIIQRYQAKMKPSVTPIVPPAPAPAPVSAAPAVGVPAAGK